MPSIGPWYRGDGSRGIPTPQKAIAFDGNRDSTAYGAAVTGELAYSAAQSGISVITGAGYGASSHTLRAAIAVENASTIDADLNKAEASPSGAYVSDQTASGRVSCDDRIRPVLSGALPRRPRLLPGHEPLRVILPVFPHPAQRPLIPAVFRRNLGDRLEEITSYTASSLYVWVYFIRSVMPRKGS